MDNHNSTPNNRLSPPSALDAFDMLIELKAFFADPQKIQLKHLSTSERNRQKQGLAKQIYYSTGAMRKLQQLTYRQTVLKSILIP